MVVDARIPTRLMKIERRPPTRRRRPRIDSRRTQQTTDMLAMMPPMSGAAVHLQKQGKDSRWMAPTERSAEQWQRRSATLSATVYSSLYCVLVALATASASSFSNC